MPKTYFVCRYSLCQKTFYDLHRDTPRIYCCMACKRAAEPERFWSYVEKTETCWLWTAYGNNGNMGYGEFSMSGGKHILAHRYSYILAHGSIPKGMCVLHNCPDGDNPLCVNPNHLWLGTRAENNNDMYQKGRDATSKGTQIHPSGEEHYNAKLTPPEVLEIFVQKGKMTVSAAAEKYGCGRTTIQRIWMKQTWRHLLALIS